MKKGAAKKKILYVIVLGVIAMMLFDILQLWPWLKVLVGAAFVAEGIVLSKIVEKSTENKKRMQEGIDYLTQITASFEQSGQINVALLDVYDLFEEGRMKDTLKRAIELFDDSFNQIMRRAALSIVAEAYPAKPIEAIHKYMLDCENYGKKSDIAMNILKEDSRRYKKRTIAFYEALCTKRKNGILAIIAGIVLAISMLFFAPDKSMLTESIVYQIGAAVFLVLSGVLVIMNYKMSCRDYLLEIGTYSDEEMMDKINRYFENKSFVGRGTLKKIIKQEISLAFPDWMLSVSVLLQSHNVESAIESSIKGAPIVLQEFLMRLTKRINDKPGSKEPYLEFLSEFKVPEISSSMKFLSALSSGDYENYEEQMKGIIEQNQIMVDASMIERQERELGKAYMLFLLPTLLTSLKLLVDMSVLLISFMSQIVA